MVRAVSSEANVEVVRRSFDAFESKDIDRWVADWAPDIEFDVSQYEPWTQEQKVYRGIPDVLAFFGEMMAGVVVLKITPPQIEAVDDERVLATYTETRRSPAEPEPHDIEVGIVYTLADARFQRVQVHSSHAAARRTAQPTG